MDNPYCDLPAQYWHWVEHGCMADYSKYSYWIILRPGNGFLCEYDWEYDYFALHTKKLT